MPDRLPPGLPRRAALLLPLAIAAGCAETPGGAPAAEQEPPGPPALRVPLAEGGLAILTPTAGFGQEENRQPLALELAAWLRRHRPALRVLPLAGTLSAINAAGLSEAYGRMYALYRDTGLFERGALRSIGAATGTRYLMQVKLAAFDHRSNSRFAYFGVNLVQSQAATTRLFVQLWDSTDGRIVWERSAETVSRNVSFRENPIGLPEAVQSAAEAVLGSLPG